MLRVLFRAALLCFGVSLSAAALSIAGLWWIALFTSVGFGFLGMSVGEGWLDPRRGSTAVAGFLGLVVVAAAGFMSLASVEQRLWPYHKSGYSLEQAHDDVWATSFTFSGGRPKPELRGEAAVFGRHSTPVDYVTVVPVVDDNAKPEDPILVWAVARKATLGERSLRWKEPLETGVRVAGFYNSDYENAVKDARARHELRPGRDPLFIDWTPTPQASLVAAWRALGTIMLIAGGALVIVNVVVKIFQPRRRSGH